MNWKEWDSILISINNENLIPIVLNWTDVKGHRIEFEYTEILDTAWIYVMDDEDYILQMYQIEFNRE